MPRSKTKLAEDIWVAMFDYVMQSADDRQQAIARRGLTPNDARALWSLDAEHGRPIGSLAPLWRCDRSNVTFIVDRLEQTGLAERRQSEGDRRVKLVTLTDLGARTRTELLDEYHRPPPLLKALPAAALGELSSALRLLADGHPRTSRTSDDRDRTIASTIRTTHD